MFHWVLALESLTITLLPPMYFFSFLYYTDIVSITFVLAMIFYALKKHFFVSSCFGFAAVLMRQTNIVWVGVIFCHIAVTHIAGHRQRKVPEMLKYEDLLKAAVGLISDAVKRPKLFLLDLRFVIEQLWSYILVLLGFIVFVFTNGSIVVGDKSAHEANIHLTQVGGKGYFITNYSNQILSFRSSTSPCLWPPSTYTTRS